MSQTLVNPYRNRSTKRRSCIDGSQAAPEQNQMNSAYSKFNKLYRHYEKELDKLYIKRENPGVYSKLKPKKPKLYITAKTN